MTGKEDKSTQALERLIRIVGGDSRLLMFGKWSHSIAMRIPKRLADLAGVKPGDQAELSPILSEEGEIVGFRIDLIK